MTTAVQPPEGKDPARGASRWRVWALLIVALLAATGGALYLNTGTDAEYERLIQSLESADAAADVKAAIARDDYRFVVVDRRGQSVPGVDHYKLPRTYDVRILKAPGDTTTHGRLHMQFQFAAMTYAQKYNALMLDQITKNGR